MASNKNTLQQLHDYGQSPWIDFISRELLTSGQLKELIEQGIVGETSNPTIFQQAIGTGDDYDEELRQLAQAGKSVSEIYDSLVLGDIRAAATILRPIYDQTNGRDGYVSIEEPPDMAYDTQKAIEEAGRLFTQLNLPNIMIKIPGTHEGIPAMQQVISEGINVNVTLVFSLDNYRKVAQAYIAGLEARAAAGKPIDMIASVASFFVSRVDTAVDQRLDELISYNTHEQRKRELKALLGKAAIANAKLAYVAYQEIFSGPRWEALARKGARTQRCLWASTSTKNPAYRDILYAEELIGPDTVDTMPLSTIEAFLDHAHVARTLDQDVEKARADYAAIERAGISMEKVTLRLQQEGVQKFADSFNQLIDTISTKRQQMMAGV